MLNLQGVSSLDGLVALLNPLFFAGLIGPTQGNVWFVRPTNGNDASAGNSPTAAFQTLARALAAATPNQNDIVLLMAEGEASGVTTSYQSSTLTWNKDMVHLIGINSAPQFSPRSRIAFVPGYATAGDLFDLTASGCLIQGIQFFMGVASALPTGCMTVSGHRNHFRNCHIAGFGNAANDISGAYDIQLKGCEENLFENCQIGVDTITCGAQANSNILTAAASGVGATRNIFRKCQVNMSTNHATNHQWLRVPASTIDRFLMFDDCFFWNAVGSGSTSLTEGMTVVGTGSPAGDVLVVGPASGFAGAGKWNATSGVILGIGGNVVNTTTGYPIGLT